MVQPTNKSFCLTPPESMRDRRVKPHLRILFHIYWPCNFGVVLLSFAGVIAFLATPAGAPVLRSVWGELSAILRSAIRDRTLDELRVQAGVRAASSDDPRRVARLSVFRTVSRVMA